MSRHQWIHKEKGNVLEVTRLEMTAVLRCAASLARKEGMYRTADRLLNDADRVAELIDQHGTVVVIVK